MQHLKTMAVLITEETYSIAVACLPGGFASYPFANVQGYWLVINDLSHRFGDEYNSPGPGFANTWIHPLKFIEQYKIINKKPGRQPENSWVEVTKALDKQMKADQDAELEDDMLPRARTRKVVGGTRSYQGRRNRLA